ncbi:MAG: tetratricopeptide repeat protein [Verrucomicrobiota bacterium]
MNQKTWALFAYSVSGILLHAEEPLALAEARKARAESIPLVAVQKLRTLLTKPHLTLEERHSAELELGRALFADKDSTGAIAVVQSLLKIGNIDAELLQAQIFASDGYWNRAATLFAKLAQLPNASVPAKLGLAESQAALGQITEAISTLESFLAEHPKNRFVELRLIDLLIQSGGHQRARTLLDDLSSSNLDGDPEKKCLDGRLLLAEDHPTEALAVFNQLLQSPNTLTDALRFSATLGTAESLLLLQRAEVADTPVEQFIARSPDSPHLTQAFQKLDQIYAKQANPSETVLKLWVKDAPPQTATLARFYSARLRIRSKNPESALKTLNTLIESSPTSPIILNAQLLQADLLLQKGNLPAAIKAIEDAERRATDGLQRAEIEMRKANIHYRQGEWLLALNSFDQASQRSPRLHQSATFNLALSALALGNYHRYSIASNAVTPALQSTLALEKGLTQARNGDHLAAETLDLFLHQSPNHPRQSEARLALSELAFAANDPRKAEEYLTVANTSNPSPETAEHAAYLAVFLAEKSPESTDERVAKEAKSFLDTYPKSALRPEVQMKLGQVYIHAGDYVGAETQLTKLGQDQPSGPYAEVALYLAGQSAMRQINQGAIDRALVLFDQVVKRDGPFKLRARQQQAIIQSQLGKPLEAIVIYDAIINSTPPPDSELRNAVLCEKGDNLILLGRKDPKQLENAILSFDEVASKPLTPPSWRNQALYKKGRALRALERDQDALATWYDVLNQPSAGEPEFFWYYKSGFEAAELCRAQKHWVNAVGLYEKIAKVPGPRSTEAKERARELRLEKFLPWD